MAAVTMAVTATMRVRAPSHNALLNNDAIAMHPRSKCSNGKENSVHNSKCPRSFKHCARLVDPPREARDAHIMNLVVPNLVSRGILTIGKLDSAQEVYAGDEGAEEAEIDKGDEERVVGGAAVGEEGEEAPGEGEDGDDEEDEDGVGGEDVCVVEFADEPAEHANWRCLGEYEYLW
ncbi:hypothetical protein Trihar35433_7986 [Trichoderma harzianum]|nr:hypothetical protein Trihar35433_7986 [Trichoderma harzianum]